MEIAVEPMLRAWTVCSAWTLTVILSFVSVEIALDESLHPKKKKLGAKPA
jgi:hypothetical protein